MPNQQEGRQYGPQKRLKPRAGGIQRREKNTFHWRREKDFMEVAELCWALKLSQISAGGATHWRLDTDASTMQHELKSSKGCKEAGQWGVLGGWGKYGRESGVGKSRENARD